MQWNGILFSSGQSRKNGQVSRNTRGLESRDDQAPEFPLFDVPGLKTIAYEWSSSDLKKSAACPPGSDVLNSDAFPLPRRANFSPWTFGTVRHYRLNDQGRSQTAISPTQIGVTVKPVE